MSRRKRIVVVGGVAGGASAAARARRLSEDAEIVMFERGEHVSFANCGLPYHIGGAIAERERLLVQTPQGLWERYRIEVHTRAEVIDIDPEERTVRVRDLESGDETIRSYDELILSPGAEPRRLPIPGADAEGVFTLRSLEDMDAIEGHLEERRPGRAVVVGAGYIGLELAEALRGRGIEVALAELAEQVFLSADPEMVAPLEETLRRHGVDLRLGASLTGIKDSEEGELAVQLSTGDTVRCGAVMLAVGVRPETELAEKAGLQVGESGGIEVDEHMRTSDPHIYAVGDAVQVRHMVDGHPALIPLAGPANRQGRVAADNALGRDSTYPGSQGTAICKVFDMTIGMTGRSEKQLRELGTDYEKVYVHPASHAGYYPGARQINLKLLFDPGDGAVLGAQAVGRDGVDKRIDVLATGLRAGMNVEQLAHLELAYAPPYGSAKDPVNYAGFVASNVLSGDMKLCHVEDVLEPDPDQMLLDVRTPSEVEAGTIPGAVNVPLDELRERLDELPRHREVLVFCKVGLRAYLACRILEQNGFQARNLTGGYTTYRHAVGEPEGGEPDREMSGDTGAEEPVALEADCASLQSEVKREVDARGLQCPGPIMRLRGQVEALTEGAAVSIVATDPGFPGDVRAWCESTGNRLVDLTEEGEATRAVVQKGAPVGAPVASGDAVSARRRKTMVLFSGDFDRAMAAFIIANGAASTGSEVTMFFTFWGLNILRRPEKVKVKKSLVERLFGWMMPRGADRLGLSRMNMGGVGTRMIKGIMRRKNVSGLPELIEQAREAGVRMVACSMSMDLMGIKRQELIDGVEEGGVASFLNSAEAGRVNLFI